MQARRSRGGKSVH